MRALAVDRQALAVTQAAVAAQVHQPLDVHLHVAAQVALDAVVGVDDLADRLGVHLTQVVDLRGRVDLGARTDLAGRGKTDAVQVRQRVEDVLATGEVNACDTCHGCLS